MLRSGHPSSCDTGTEGENQIYSVSVKDCKNNRATEKEDNRDSVALQAVPWLEALGKLSPMILSIFLRNEVSNFQTFTQGIGAIFIVCADLMRMT